MKNVKIIKMQKSILNTGKEYLLYIIANKRKNTFVGIAGLDNITFALENKKYSKLVYYKKFNSRKSAIGKLKTLSEYNEDKIIGLVSEKNPEWLNLNQIFFAE